MYLYVLYLCLDICPGEGLLDHMATLLFFEEPYSVFYSGCTNLHFLSAVSEGSLFSSIWFCRFLNGGHLTGIRWHLIAVSACISQLFSDVEHLFMCLLVICMSSLETFLFRSSA